MKTGTLVVTTTAAGIVGGIVGALLFLMFFAEEFRPKPAPETAASPAAREFTPEEATALRRLPKRLEEIETGLEALRRDRRPASPAPSAPGSAAPAPAAPLSAADELRRNETAAIATLRNLASCQAQVQTSGKIDCDNDGIGEYGTFQEMTGGVAVRKDAVWSTRGANMSPPILSPALASVDPGGRVTRNGYVFQIFLPDDQGPAQWTHETQGGGFAGGTSRVNVDFSETTWCAYAWPLERGKTGNRAFFVNQSGDVLQSANEGARHAGMNEFDPASAFRSQGITGRIAVGTHGNDGDVWKVTN